MNNYSVFTFYGKEEIARDIIHYCVKNPNGLNFGSKLQLEYRKLEFGCAYLAITIDYKDYITLADFSLIAGLVKEV